MKDTKDIFSQTAAEYASFRPPAPGQLIDYLCNKAVYLDTAWDCGTGNGQVAVKLSQRFKRVHATDISRQQLSLAVQKANIDYRIERVEQTSLPANSISLITAAQAVHWFDFDPFYSEVNRVAKNGCLVAFWTYFTPRISEGIDRIIDDFYQNKIAQYWDNERRYIDEHYRTIPFPFEELKIPEFSIELAWNREQLLGYLGTWSSVQHYISRHGSSPVLQIKAALEKEWENDQIKTVVFPLYTRVGRVVKED